MGSSFASLIIAYPSAKTELYLKRVFFVEGQNYTLNESVMPYIVWDAEV
jgi:hypothetical protein